MTHGTSDAGMPADRVENYLDEKAVVEWQKRRWMRKFAIADFMAWLKKLDHKAATEEVDEFAKTVATKAPVNYGFMGVKSYMEEDALKAWDEGRWKGRVNVEVLVEKLLKPLGRKATIADIDAFVEEGDRRKQATRELFDAKSDPDVKVAVTCGCPDHQGENLAFMPEIEYATRFDAQLQKRVRKTYKDSDEEVRAGQFLVVDDKIVAYCKYCKRAANDRREEKRDAAYKKGVNGRDLPRRLVWMTYGAALETLGLVKKGLESRDQAEAMEDQSLDSFLTSRHRAQKGQMRGGRSKGREYRR